MKMGTIAFRRKLRVVDYCLFYVICQIFYTVDGRKLTHNQERIPKQFYYKK
jgi:hypothetical protein